MPRYLVDNSSGDIVVVSDDDDYTFDYLSGGTPPTYSETSRYDSRVTVDGPAVAAFSLTSGDGTADTTGKPSIVYVQITGASSGTVLVEVKADGGDYVELIAATADNAVASQVIPVPLPPLGTLKVTVSAASIAAAVQYTWN